MSAQITKTLGQQLEEHNNFGPGFNFARIFLAYAVVIWHSVAVADNWAKQALLTDIWPFIYAILPMFFALSGFLVTGSALRLPLREYIFNRVFRIFPALGVDVAISALIIGPIFTTVALSVYFTDPNFIQYFGNVVGMIQYDLPGVFVNNTFPGIVNSALWTVPYEIGCYIIMSMLIYLGLIRSWKWVLGCAIAIVVTAITCHQLALGQGDDFISRWMQFLLFHKGSSLIPSFLVGSAIFLLKDRIPYSFNLALGMVLAYLACAWIGGPSLYEHPTFIGLSSFPLAYIVVWVGLTPIKIPDILEKGDYSYGIYLYHFPIMQALNSIFGFSSWWSLSIGCIIPVTLFAAFSWHAIEKPTLKMRKKFSLVGARLAQA